MPPQAEKIYFKDLDGVRAIAATLVVVWHIELHRHYYYIQNFAIPDLGYVGVTFFLVLSGFLITYLLFAEKSLSKTVEYKSFYMRRVLRIWPLYFLVLLFGYFIFPRTVTNEAFLLSALFLPNFALLLNLLPTVIDPIWSIGVEEQFYLIQPHILRIKKPVKILWVLVSLIGLWYLAKIVVHFIPDTPLIVFLKKCLILFRYDALLLGSIMALLFYNYKNTLFKPWLKMDWLFHPATQVAAFSYLSIFMLFKTQFHNLLRYESLTLATAIIVLNLCNEQTSLLSLNNSVFRYVGKISYGFYLVHKLPLVLVIFFLDRYAANLSPLIRIPVIYIFTIGGGLLIASLSFRYFESFFLRLKLRFSKLEPTPGKVAVIKKPVVSSLEEV